MEVELGMTYIIVESVFIVVLGSGDFLQLRPRTMSSPCAQAQGEEQVRRREKKKENGVLARRPKNEVRDVGSAWWGCAWWVLRLQPVPRSLVRATIGCAARRPTCGTLDFDVHFWFAPATLCQRAFHARLVYQSSPPPTSTNTSLESATSSSSHSPCNLQAAGASGLEFWSARCAAPTAHAMRHSTPRGHRAMLRSPAALQTHE